MVRGRRIGAAGMVKAARIIPPAVRAKQAAASNPRGSYFVSANAGSGKTHVLVQRVIRLLLTGVPPEKILCITFTKAAAANMAERVFTTLGHWVTLDDVALDAAITDAGVPNSGPKLREIARKLFAQALETPGGLKVQTIHALCTRLLQQFPFEANVPARFAVLDERDQEDMMERANLKVFLEAANAPDSVLGRALLTAMANAADVTFKDVVREACLARDHFMAWADSAGSAGAAAREVSAALGVAAADNIETIEREIVDGPYLPHKRWLEIAATFDGASKTDLKQADQLRASLAFTGSAQVEEYLCVFLTDDKAPRANVLTKGFIRDNPAIAHLFAEEILRLGPLIETRRAVITRDRTEALLHIATAAAANYRREKDERGLLDYDDLIDKTLAMLNKVSAGWVHYKLDRGVDHVLIDEAQDTSPRQWDIVEHIIAEFAAGKGARDETRTVFAVGDEKQSIFSFQGAAPREFDARRQRIGTRFSAAGLAFEPISFTYSFRSGAAVLRAVEHAFRSPDIYKSITTDRDGMPRHEWLDDAGPSLIELWPLAEADKREEIEGWRAPFDGVSVTSPEVKLSKRIQAEIKRLVASGTLTGPRGNRRPLSYGDVLVLVRRRGNLFDAVIQALKHASIPVAGADRLKLTEHIAIIDLMNLADALLLPRDDLALAVALKSPLFGLGEDDLFKLAWERKGSLRMALSNHAKEDQKFEGVLRRLEECELRFAHDTPFAFYAWLLGGDGGRARILRRLGHEANDALDEFLELALNYERKAPSSLQGFMAWLRSADTEVKRDMEISRDEVRVMTVHGAKGLEAPVVIMVDTTSSPSDTQRLRLIQVPHEGREVTVWAGRKADDPRAVVPARDKMLDDTEDEYRRLLYVAMTRAADRLIVAGIQPGNRNGVRPDCWYDLVKKGLANSGLQEEAIDTDDGQIKRYMRAEDGAHATGAAASAAITSQQLPSWLRAPMPSQATTAGLLRPSQASGDAAHRVKSTEAIAQRTRALQQGTLVHRLLQSLPDLPPERRRDAALAHLLRNAPAWSAAEREQLAGKAIALITGSRFAAVFAEGSRAEVAIVGRLTLPGRPTALVSGQIDRLVVTQNEVLIVDFKTNHAPPKAATEAPQAYVRQLALYRAVLSRLYPQHGVRAALLWTETADLMEISASALDAELASLGAGIDPATPRS